MDKINFSDFYYLKYNGILLKSCNKSYCAKHKDYIENNLTEIKNKMHSLILKAKDEKSFNNILNIYAKSIKKLLESKKGIASQTCSYKYCSEQLKNSLLSVINIVKKLTEKSIRNGNIDFDKYSKKIKKEKDEVRKKIYINKAKNISDNMNKSKKVYDKMLKYEDIINKNKLTVNDIIDIKLNTIRSFIKAL